MGINSMTFGIGGVIGPVLGGLILSVASWRWIFFINVPIGIAGTLFGYSYMRQLGRRRTGESLDVVGVVIFTVGLLALLFALTQSIEMGFTSTVILGLFALFGAALLFFLFWEKRSTSPALDLRLFSNNLYNFSVLAASLQSLAMFAVQFLVVFYLQAVKDESPLTAALLLLPMPIGLSIFGPFSGRLSDRIGARIPATMGLLLQAAGVYWLSTVRMDSTYLHLAIGLTLTGIGGGFFFSPNTSAAMGAADKERLGIAAATLATLRNVGMVTSFALSLAIAARSIPQRLMLQLFVGTEVHLRTSVKYAFVHGMEVAFHVSVGICLLAALMSLVRGREVKG
jgi:MFS family permease